MTDLKPLIICEPTSVEAAKIAKGYEIQSISSQELSVNGRRVILWPDATPESRHNFKVFAEQISDQCEELDLIIPNGRPHGWNIAVALQNGETWDVLAKWAKVSMLKFGRGEFQAAISIETHEAPEEVPHSVQEIWDSCGLEQNKSGIIYNIDNLVRLFSHDPKFKDMVWYDDFYGRYFTNRNKQVKEWQDIDDINLTVLLQREYGMPKLRTLTVSEAIQCRGHQCHRNEPKEWLERLKWDGRSRISRFFCDYMGSGSSAYHLAVGHNFWVGMVARIYEPGCQLDNMVILEGKQGIFKSKALEAIGGKWYMEASEDITSKDFFVALGGKLIVEIADLDSFSRADTNRIKKVITCRIDRYRQPYGRASQDHARQSIFVGTTNERHYLTDNTGARRFWPVTCGHIALDRIKSDREQLFAEAVTAYIGGATWYQVPEMDTLSEQEDRRQFDEWESLVGDFLHESCKTETSLTDVGAAIGIASDRMDTPIQKRLGGILRRLGWEAKSIWRQDRAVRRWVKTSQPPSSAPASSLLLKV